MIPRTLFSSEHELLPRQRANFLEKEAVPFHAQWENRPHRPNCGTRQGGGDAVLASAGGIRRPGADFLYSAVVIGRGQSPGLTGIGFSLHSDIVAPYILHYGSEALKQNTCRSWSPARWSPPSP
jgi:acyl-CoA dehydrogenase